MATDNRSCEQVARDSALGDCVRALVDDEYELTLTSLRGAGYRAQAHGVYVDAETIDAAAEGLFERLNERFRDVAA